ncbi:MAG: PEP-CTERM sorting domain-containing protein [Bacteroidia bacterium]
MVPEPSTVFMLPLLLFHFHQIEMYIILHLP